MLPLPKRLSLANPPRPLAPSEFDLDIVKGSLVRSPVILG